MIFSDGLRSSATSVQPAGCANPWADALSHNAPAIAMSKKDFRRPPFRNCIATPASNATSEARDTPPHRLTRTRWMIYVAVKNLLLRLSVAGEVVVFL